MNRKSQDTFGNVALILAAIVMAGSVAWRVWSRGEVPPPAGAELRRIADGEWKEALDLGIALDGPRSAPLTIVEFLDFECPACRSYERHLSAFAEENAPDVQIVYVALPILGHRFSMPAARAMECADSMGAARKWMRTALRLQDSIGLLSWREIASRAGIEDAPRIESCALTAAEYPRLEASIRFAERAGVRSTPTLWVAGRQHVGGIPRAMLDSLLQAAKPAR